MARTTQSLRWLILSALLCAGTVSCDNGIRILNVAPEITALGPVKTLDGTAAITLWLYDYETDAVDIELLVIRNGEEIALSDVSGDGLFGLTTSREATGRPHTVLWAVPDDIGTDDEIRLKAIPTDGDEGRTFTTPAFTLDTGLPAP